MISNRAFQGILKRITTKGRELDELIAQGVQYCVQQSMNGNFAFWPKLAEACPVYARKVIKEAEKAARATHDAKNWKSGADEEAFAATAEVLEERRTKGEARKPKKADAPKKEEAVQDAPKQAAQPKQYTLAAGEETVKLSKAEYDHLMAKLTEYRTAPAKPKKAAQPKKEEAVQQQQLKAV